MNEVATKELPENWVRGQILDLVTIRNGYAFKSKDFKDEGGVPVIRQTNLSSRIVNFNKPKYLPVEFLEEFESYKINNGDILIGLSGSIGNLSRYLLDEPALQNQRTGLLVEHVPGSIKYVEYYLQLIKEQLLDAAKGVAVQDISSKTIESLDIPIAPPEQQKRIVAKIEELFSHIDAGIEALKKAKQLLKQYRQSVLKAAVTGELTKEWRKANKDKLDSASQLLERILKERRQKWEGQQLEQFKAKGKMPKDDKWKEKYKEPLGYSYEGELPEIPDSWTWVSPEQVASTDDYSLAIGPFGSNLKVSDYCEEGVPLVFVRNIRAHDYSTVNTKYVTHKKAKELRAHSISAGDVLITKMGDPPGDASIYPSTALDAIITADCIKWRFSKIIERPELYVHIINSQLLKSQMLNRTKGVAQKKISLGTFRSVAFPLLSLDEQAEMLRQIEQKFYASDRLLKELNVQLLKTEKNKQSVLASAFVGSLQG